MEGKRLTLDMLTKHRFVMTSTMHRLPNEVDSYLNAKGMVRQFQFFVSNLARAAVLALEQYPLAIAELPEEIGENHVFDDLSQALERNGAARVAAKAGAEGV